MAKDYYGSIQDLDDEDEANQEEQSRLLLNMFRRMHGSDELGRPRYEFPDSVPLGNGKLRSLGNFLEFTNLMRESNLPELSYETPLQRQVMQVVTNGLGWERDVYTSAIKKIRGQHNYYIGWEFMGQHNYEHNYDTGMELKAHLERMETGNRCPINNIPELVHRSLEISRNVVKFFIDTIGSGEK